MTVLEAERLAIKCRECGSDIILETEMPGRDQTDQTTDQESMQAMFDALGGLVCLECR